MSENIFYTKFSELSGNRIDPFYYIPELVELEKQVRKISKKRLRDFVLSVSSGATPKKSVTNEYYAEDEKDGIPFLRVQNLTKYGKIDFKGLKFITKATHEGMLKRSQVEEDNLLVKITGVGRMAIASVPEKGFAGNTNQHMVVIKTKDRRTSETLATYLNLDIAEKLASRRATGGTRPALDYPALLSIPVVYDEIIVIKLQDAYKQKEQKEKEAQNKLDNINDYLLSELGIQPFCDEKESLEDRVFFRKLSELSGDRFDSVWQLNMKYSISGGKYENKSLYQIANVSKGQSITSAQVIDGIYPVIAGGQSSPYSHNEFNQEKNVITVSASGAYSGFVWYHNNRIFASDCSVIRSKNETEVMTEYLAEILKLKQTEIYKLQQGAGQPHVYPRDLEKLLIPIPDTVNKQIEIVSYIKKIREQVKSLNQQAIDNFEKAKKEVEEMLLKADK